MHARVTLDRLPVHGADGAVHVVVEAMAGTRNKLKYEPALGAFALHHVLPLGTSFPYGFGFVPSTLGGDGDPLDAVLFADEPLPPGTVAACRMVGVIEAEQGRPGQARYRNDRLLAVARENHLYGDWHDLADVPPRVLDELERFFAFYDRQRGIDFVVLGRGDAERAGQLLAQGLRP